MHTPALMLPIRRILLPVDFGPNAASSIAWALRFAQRHRAALDILHVWEGSKLVSPQVRTAGYLRLTLAELARAHARRALYALVRREILEDPSVRITLRVEMGRAHERISALASEYDLIVMNRHDGSELDTSRIGTVTVRVLGAARCPVITLPRGSTHGVSQLSAQSLAVSAP